MYTSVIDVRIGARMGQAKSRRNPIRGAPSSIREVLLESISSFSKGKQEIVCRGL